MSAARFKSRDDYFSKKTNLAKKVLNTHKNGTTDTPAGDSIDTEAFITAFYGATATKRFASSDMKDSLADTVNRHLLGESTLSIMPTDTEGIVPWHVVLFSTSLDMDHPFTKAKTFCDKLSEYGIGTLIEVTGEGKGHYHVWIFHDEQVDPESFTEALRSLSVKHLEVEATAHPSSASDNAYITLPLQGESRMLQRSVFVNSVGKMRKNQSSVLRDITPADQAVIKAFISSFDDSTEDVVSDHEPDTKKKAEKPSSQKRPKSKRPEKTKSKKKPVTAEKEPPVVPDDSDQSKRFVTCWICGEQYAIPAETIKRILELSELIPLPESDTSLVGIVHDRERGIPVIDPGIALEGKKTAISPKSRIILLQTETRTTGIIVEKTSGIELAVPVTESASGNKPFVDGLVKREKMDGLIPNVDVSAVVAEGEKVFSQRPEPQRIREDGRFVIVTAGDVWCAFPTENVKEILRWTMMPGINKSRALPHQVITYDDRVIPLYDLRISLGSEERSNAASGKPTRIIILTSGESVIGVRVDSVEGIRRISGGDIKVHEGRSGYAPMVSGYTRLQDSGRVIMILDPGMLAAVET